MGKKILVTGGAGFIGSHIVDALVKEGNDVRIFDNLEPQVHGKDRHMPAYVNKDAEFIRGDVRDRDALKKAMLDADIVFHKAAAVGVGQSMYEIEKYVSVNTLGAAVLLDILVNEKNHIEKLIVASSMSVYGEGEYDCPACGRVYPKLRPLSQFARHDWEMKCPKCNGVVSPLGTSEEKPLFPTSIYAISKRDHEEMFLSVGRAYNIPTVALRYFNVYGPRQALSNPYTGIAAIFSSRIINNNPPLIFEDGLQSRDFIHVSDIVQANLLAMKSEKADYEMFNVGTGRRLTVLDMAAILSEKLGFTQPPLIVNKFREGDIRHCYGDISKIKGSLGFEPKVAFENGIKDLTEWVKKQEAIDSVTLATEELKKKGLVK